MKKIDLTKRFLNQTPFSWMLWGALSFSLMAAATRQLNGHCPWAVIAFIRALFTLLSAAFIAKSSGLHLFVHHPPMLWLRSLAGSVGMLCTFYSTVHLPLADSITLYNIYPFWIVIIVSAFSGKLPSFSEILAIISGIIGIVLLMHPNLTMNSFSYAIAIFGSLAAAVAMMSLHKLKGIRTSLVVAHFSATSCIASFICLLVTFGETSNISHYRGSTILLLGIVGFVGTIGQFCITKAYAHGKPIVIGAIAISEVAFGVIFDVLFWHRNISASLLCGVALTMLPVWILRTKQIKNSDSL